MSSDIRRAQVMTASPVGRVVLLYEGAIRYIHRHLYALEQGNHEAAHAASLRAQDIVSELRSTLDMDAGGELARSLDAIYASVLAQLARGNVERDPQPSKNSLALLQDLSEAWQAIAAQQRAAALPAA
jgi:flagellar secretion chaperone FliS